MSYQLIVENVGTFTYDSEQESKQDFNNWKQAIINGNTSRADSLTLIDLKRDFVEDEFTKDDILLATGWNWYEYTIADIFLSALINGDDSGLEPEDIEALDSFIESLPNEAKQGHWDVIEDSENFCECDISGLYNNCVSVRLMFKQEGK